MTHTSTLTAAKEDVPAAPAPAPAPASPRTSATDKAAARLAKLQGRLKAARKVERHALDARASLIGHACLAEAAQSREFRHALVAALRRHVRAVDRHQVAALLAEDAS